MMSVDGELIVLIDKALSKIAKLLRRLVSPPVHQVAVLVILTTYNAH